MSQVIRKLVGAVLLFAWGQAAALESGVVTWKNLVPEKHGNVEIRSIMEGQGQDFAYLRVTAETLPGREVFEKYYEDMEELLIIKEGELDITVGDASKVMGPGSIAVIHPGDKRRVKNTQDTPATFYAFRYRARLPVNVARGREAGGSFMVDWDDVEYVPSDIGGRRNILPRRATAMFSNFQMHVSTLNEGLLNHAIHTHSTEEFVLMLKGDVTMPIGGEDVAVSEGDVVFLESMIPHALRNTGKGAATYFAFQFWE